MTDRQFIQWMRDQCDVQLATPPDGGGGEVESPTGRQPRLLWTSALQRTYNRMVDEHEAGDDTLGARWCDLIFDNARAANYYGDYTGVWAWIAYQMTGDPAWVAEAWEKVEEYILGSTLTDQNSIREYGLERVMALDWLWPGLTETQRGDFLAALYRQFSNAGILNGTIRTTDSDQSTGVYFAVVAFHLAFHDVYPETADFFNAPIVGGLDATEGGRDTLRKAVFDYVANMAAGGEWIESSEYNLGTVRLLMTGAACARTASGADHFPEIAAWMPTAALRYTLMTTPDRAQSFQWGDNQKPHQFDPSMWSTSAMLFNDPAARLYVHELVDRYGARGDNTAQPMARGFLLFDPYGPQAQTEVRVLDGRGQGIMAARSAHEPSASLLCTHLPPAGEGAGAAGVVDHAVFYCCDAQLYRRNRWALTHPICYAGVGNDGRGLNGTLLRGIGAPREWRGSVRCYAGDDWVFVAATAGGTILQSKFYQPPPTFWHEHSRSMLCLFGEVDTLIVFDRSHADDPLALPNCAKYPDDIEKKFNAHPLRLFRWHMPVAPTITGCQARWAIGDEQARITWLRSDLDTYITNQAVDWSSYNMLASEKKFHLDLVPEDCAFYSLITVLEFGDPAKFATAITPFEDVDNHLAAVSLERAGAATIGAMFNTTPGPRLPTYAGESAYHPEVPGLLRNVRFRDYPIPTVAARVWGMETESSLPTLEP